MNRESKKHKAAAQSEQDVEMRFTPDESINEADYDWNQSVKVSAAKAQTKLISIRLPMPMIKKLRYVARTRGDIGYQQLIRSYVSDGLENDSYVSKQELLGETNFLMNITSGSSCMNQEFPIEEYSAGSPEKV